MTRGIALLLGLCLLLAACGGEGQTTETTRLVTVPDLVGRTADYARGALDAGGLVADVVEAAVPGEPGTVAGQVPAPGTQVAPGSSVVVKVPATTTTTTTTTTTVPETTTTTVDPTYAAALAYFALLARNNPASQREAADGATTLAADYANYLAAGGDSGADGTLTEDDGIITVCYPGENEGADECYEFSDFSLTSGKFAHFSVDGRPLRARIWPTSYLTTSAGHAWCRQQTSAYECAWDDPELDRNLYIFNSYAYISARGATFLIWDVITGARDLDVIYNRDGTWASFLTDSEGVKHYAEGCWSTLAVGSSLGLRINRGQRGYLSCSFPGLEQPGVNTESTVTLVINWGGNTELEYDLKDLPD